MTNINKTVDSLLTLFEQYEATSVQTEQILEQCRIIDHESKHVRRRVTEN